MALKFDPKLMKVADEFADFDLLKPKSQPGPEFQSQETESNYIITVYLEGYRRTNINVERTEDGSRIIIKGGKPFQDMLNVAGKVVKKHVEMRGFQKSFRVPQGVVLNKIHARFDENDSKLVIRMPKATKGLIGAKIEELETEEIRTKSTKPIHVYTNEEISEQEDQKAENDNVQDVTNESQKEEVSPDREQPKSPRRRFKICTPAIFGSAFLVTLIVLVIHLVQTEKPVKQQKNKDQD
ncbi:uncharacterized protein [Rutidosis leptorrhynchoides]|uniref:uncharacterized protein n=1 Tax=Rutidosis leptorrhynchoides TaxID=125765 RepID=UPI003A999F38